jgi:hypothetical protein
MNIIPIGGSVRNSADLFKSNSLADLAARIKIEHEATAVALKRSVEHAMAAGNLLIEAKAQVPHGQWLPWLKANCSIPERTAQLYMRLAQRRPELEAKSASLADLTLEGATRLLAKPGELQPEANEFEPGSWEWAEVQMNCPFSEWDFSVGGKKWLRTKLMHLANVPTLAAMSIEFADEYDLPVIRVCDSGDILQALTLLAPIAKGHYALPLHSTLQYPKGAIVELELRAQRVFVVFFDEVKRRATLAQDQWQHERDEILRSLTAKIEATEAEWDEIRSITDEGARWARVDEFLSRHGWGSR